MALLKFVPVLLLVALTACKLDDTVHNPVHNPAPYEPEIMSIGELCMAVGGSFTPAYNDCDATTACQHADRQSCMMKFRHECSKVGGMFNACASACRNNPDARACTKQCVPVCRG